jgi:hypothetical protein
VTRLVEIAYKSGVVKDETELAGRPRWRDSDRIRFVRGLPQKVGGWEKYLDTAFTGVARAMMAWQDSSSVARLAVGTECKVEVLESDTWVDITPVRLSGTLTDPFDTTAGSTTVTVNHAGNGVNVGDFVTFSDATAVGGITIDGEYQATTIVTDGFTIEHTVSAGTTVTGGGGTVTYSYQLNCGTVDATRGQGYGIGNYGEGTYGTASDSFVILSPRIWFLEQWGEYLLASPSGGSIYEWQLQSTTPAALLTNAPTSNKGIMVTEEQHLVALGAGGNKMRLEWCDQSDNTDWTPSDVNTAGGRDLQGGSEIVGGIRTRGTNLIFTDAAVWTMTHIGGLDTFGFEQASSGASGMIAPHAACDVDGVGFWMGINDFYLWDGVVRRVPNSKDIRRFVFDNITRIQREKCFAFCNTMFSEIWWLYPTGTEITRYVKYNYDDRAWDVGTLVRTAGIDRGTFDLPLMADASSFVQQHESGVDDDGSAMNEFIESTPKNVRAGNAMLDVLSFYPDFKNVTGPIDLVLLTRDYPQAAEEKHEIGALVGGTTRIDCRARGRQAGLRISSDLIGTDWRLGTVHVEVVEGGQR